MQKRKLYLYLMVAMLLCLMKADASRAAWTDVTPGVSATTLFAVWGSSASDVYAVGNTGTILHYNGTDWSAETSNTTGQLLSIWGSSSTNIYAVGKEESGINKATLLRKKTAGGAWEFEELKDYNNVFYDYDIYTVWGYAANKVYAGDTYGELFFFDGTGWSKIDPGPGVGSVPITGIWATTSTNVFVTAPTRATRFNGTEWIYAADANNPGSVNEVWGAGIDNVYIAGEQGFISRYNGSAWLAVSSGTSKDLNSIHGSSASNVFAVGAQGAIVHNKGAGFVDESFNTANDLFGVWASPDGQAAFAVGTDGIILKHEPDPVTTTTTTPGGNTTTTTTILGDADGDGVIDENDECPDTPPATKVNAKGCPKKKCFARNTLGDNAPELSLLRSFRDNKLANTAVGRRVIQIYYNNADSINSALDRSPALRAVTRRLLETIAPMVGNN